MVNRDTYLRTQVFIQVGCVPTAVVATTRCQYGGIGLYPGEGVIGLCLGGLGVVSLH